MNERQELERADSELLAARERSSKNTAAPSHQCVDHIALDDIGDAHCTYPGCDNDLTW